MRKVITLILAAAMALSLVVITSAASQETVYLKVDKDEAKDGNTVTYTFALDASKSDGVGALEFYVETTELTYQSVTYYKDGEELDKVFKPSTVGVVGGVTDGSYSFTNNNNQGYFVGYGGDAETGRLLTGEVELISLTYTITDSANYKLTVKSGNFKACYSGERQALNNGYICKVRTGDVLLGDVNGDDNINIFDALMILQHIKGDIDLSDVPAADVNGDGNINIFDALMILQHIKGDIDLTA